MDKQALMTGLPASSMIGMPIYSLETGRRLGAVKDVILKKEDTSLLAFTIEERGFFSPHRWVLPFDQVKSVGQDAIMVESGQVFVRDRDMPEVREATRHEKTMSGKAMVTTSGNRLGSTADVLLDPNTGKPVSVELSRGVARDIQRGRSYVNAPRAELVGIDAVIVPDDTETFVEEQEPGGLTAAYGAAKERGKEYAGQAGAYTQEKEIEMSRGRVAGNDVYDDDGTLIVAKGDRIDDLVIDIAVRRNKMHQVAMAAGVGEAAAAYERGRERVGGAAAREQAGTYWDQFKAWARRTRDNLAHSTNDYASRGARKQAVYSQKQFLKGRLAASEVRYDNGEVALREGEVITPLILDTLDRQGLLESVKVKPEPVQEASAVHLVVEKPEEHTQHKTRTHI